MDNSAVRAAGMTPQDNGRVEQVLISLPANLSQLNSITVVEPAQEGTGGGVAALHNFRLEPENEIAVGNGFTQLDEQSGLLAPIGEGTEGNAAVPGHFIVGREANEPDEVHCTGNQTTTGWESVLNVLASSTRGLLSQVTSPISSLVVVSVAGIGKLANEARFLNFPPLIGMGSEALNHAKASGISWGEWARNDPNLEIPTKIPVDFRVFAFILNQASRGGYKEFGVAERADILSKAYNNFISAAKTNGVGELLVPWDDRAPIRCVEVAVLAVKWNRGQIERRQHHGRLSTKALSSAKVLYAFYSTWQLTTGPHSLKVKGCLVLIHFCVFAALSLLCNFVDGYWLAYRCRLEEFNLPKACDLLGVELVRSREKKRIIECNEKPEQQAVARTEESETEEKPAQQAAALADSKGTEDRTSGNREEPVDANIDSLHLITDVNIDTSSNLMHPATEHALFASTDKNHEGESSKVKVERPEPIPIDTSDIIWATATVEAVEEAVGDIEASVDLGSTFLRRQGPGALKKRDTRLEPDMSIVTGTTSIVENARGKRKAEDTAVYLHVGPGWAQNIPIVFAKSKLNELVALTRRHMNVLHSPDDPSVARWKVLTLKFQKILAGEYFPLVEDPMGLEEWLSTQPTNKAERYRKDLEDGKLFTAMNREFAGDHYRQAFLKDELRLQEVDKVGVDQKPRLIQGLAEPFIQMYLGWLTKSVAYNFRKNFLKHAVNGRQMIFSMSSYTNDDGIGEWYHTYKSEGWHFFENDFSSFDSTQGHGCAILETSVLEMFCNHWMSRMQGTQKQTQTGYALLGLHQQALKFQMKTKGRTAFYNYGCFATRKSGDPNTSIGNSLINMCSNAYAIVDYLNGLKIYKLCTLTKDVRIMVNGDDCLLAIHPRFELRHLAGLTDYVPKYMDDLGLKSKFKYSGIRPTYCSRIFVPISLISEGPHGPLEKETYGLAIDIPKYVSKCGFTVNHLNRGETAAERTLAGLKSVAGAEWMPVYKHLLSAYGEVTGKRQEVLDIVRHHQVSGKRVIRDYQWALDYYGVGEGDLESLGLHIAKGVKACAGAPFYYSSDVLEGMWRSSQRPAETIESDCSPIPYSNKECSFAVRDGASVTREAVKIQSNCSKRNQRANSTQDSRHKIPVKDEEKSAQPQNGRPSSSDTGGSVPRRALPAHSGRPRDAKRGKAGDSNRHNQLQHAKRDHRVADDRRVPSRVSTPPAQ